MSEPESSGASNTSGAPAKGVSTARNVIGIVALIVFVAWAGMEFSARSAYNSTVGTLNARIEDETKEPLSVQEAETLLGKAPDGPGTDVTEGAWNFTKKTYTWHGLVKSYTLTAYYTKQLTPVLHHVETEGAHLEAEKPARAPAADAGEPTPKRPARKIASEKGKGSAPEAKESAESPAKKAAAEESETPGPAPDTKAAPGGAPKSGAAADTKSAPPADTKPDAPPDKP
jgi:hypothetical protein